MLIMMYYMSRTEFLATRFFDTFCIQCIFNYKLRSQPLGSIIKYLFHRAPSPRNKKMVYRIALFICRQTISMKNLNGKQNHRPGKDREGHLQLPHEILLNDRYSLQGVYWIISCISLVPLCFLLGDTSK